MVGIETIRGALAHKYAQPWRLLRRRRCSVRVGVFVWGRNVDTFESADAERLRAALAPIYRHLPAAEAAVRLTGIEEETWPLGGGRCHRERELADPAAAQAFLGD